MLILYESSRFGRLEFQFRLGSSVYVYVCQMCGATRRDTLTPVRSFDPEAGEVEERYEQTGATLCETCCLSPDIGGGWWGHTLEEMRALWAAVRAELAREAEKQAGRERAIATCLEEIQASFAACEKAIADERVNDSRKVA